MRIIDRGPEFYELLFDDTPESMSGPYCAVDLEATGIDFSSESVIQIGALLCDGSGAPVDGGFQTLVDPGRATPRHILELCGIDEIALSRAPAFPVAFAQFQAYAESRSWVTQAGYEFDIPLLLRETQLHGVAFSPPRVLDVKAIFALRHPETDACFTTDYLLEHYGLSAGASPRHDALSDARLIARIFRAQLKEGLPTAPSGNPVRVRRFALEPKPPLVWTGRSTPGRRPPGDD